MIRYSFFIILFASGLLSAMAADPVLSGVVKDEATDMPLKGVIVKAKGAFSSTDQLGRFALSPAAGADSVSFRCMGYAPLTLPVSADLSIVRLTEKVTVLNDVIVAAPDIYARGDTLVFNVSRYASEKDNAIIDVIKRLPGIKVREDGTIEYQGKPINKFYLDGNDFIGGQYGLATNNISHKDVKAVEVMENHQPVKALEGIEFPEEAGINLKLKDDARSRWVGVTQAAGGIQPALFNASLFTMRLASRMQNMFTLKADNTGWNPANEIRDHDFDLMFSDGYSPSVWPQYIAADIISSPLAEKYTRDNISWLANAITAWKRGDTSMRLRFDYSGDRLLYNSSVSTDYFSSQIPLFIQNNAQRTHSQDVSAQFYSETNKRGYYLKDKFSLNGAFEKSISDISGSFNLNQEVVRKSLSAVNDLKLVKRTDKKIFTLTARTSFDCSPDRLVISGEEEAVQKVGCTDFRNTVETRFGKLTRFWKYYLTVGSDISFRRFSAMLSGMNDFDNDSRENAFLSDLYASPQIDYERNGWRISLGIPLNWKHYIISGNHDYLNASPKLTLHRQLTAKSELSASFSYRLSSPDPYLDINIPVMADYRNIFIGFNTGKYSHEGAASLSYRYRNPMKSLFFNISAGYNLRHNPLISHQVFIDDFIISTYTDHASYSATPYLKAGISKGIGHSKMVAGIDGEAYYTFAQAMRNESLNNYRQASLSLKPYLKGSILKWLSLNYEAGYSFSRLSISQDHSLSHSFRQNLFVSILPHDRVDVTLGAEHYLNRLTDGNASNLFLLDASAVWRLNDKVRLSLSGKNLLNNRWYSYTSYGILSSSEQRFQIRQRCILASIQYRF